MVGVTLYFIIVLFFSEVVLAMGVGCCRDPLPSPAAARHLMTRCPLIYMTYNTATRCMHSITAPMTR